MSSRLFAGLLLIALFVAWKLPTASSGQETKTSEVPTAKEIKWEYRVHRIDGRQCAVESAFSEPLTRLGLEGWELVAIEHSLPVLPKDAEGTLVIRPAATGPGREHTPMTADSFEGNIHMHMAEAPAQPGVCLLILKRPGRTSSR